MATNNRDNTLPTLALAALLAVGIAVMVSRFEPPRPGATISAATTGEAAKAAAPARQWAASAPGRVEPRGGEIKIVAQSPGRILNVLASVNDPVAAGDPLIRLDSADIVAKLTAAEAEVSVRRRERDTESITNQLAKDRRSAEDTLYTAERSVAAARAEVDRLMMVRPVPASLAADLTAAREAVTQARGRIETAQGTLRKAQAVDGVPAYTRLEAALTAARVDVMLAEIAHERMTVRAPTGGVILQSMATVGELAAPSPEAVLMVMGDISALKVKAEIEERDIGKVKIGQVAVLKSDAYPDKEFSGKISALGRSLGPSKLGGRGPRKPTDVDVMDVTIDVEGSSGLLPGMRVDVFFKP